MKDFDNQFSEALSTSQTITIYCNCSIEYDGRAQSFLTQGDRVILIKQDGNLLVHQPDGSTPINYMKQGANHTLRSLGEGSYLISSSESSKKEFMKIMINQLHHFHALKLEDGKKLVLKGTEKDMAEMIMNKPSLISSDFTPLSMEEHTKYGFIDVFGHDKDNTLIVVECKRYTADLSAVTQLRRYVEKIKKSKGIEAVKGVLASPKISPNALKMLLDWGFEHKQIEPPKYLEKYKTAQKSLAEF